MGWAYSDPPVVQNSQGKLLPETTQCSSHLLLPPGATYLICRPVLPASEGCLASQDPGIIGWMGWLSRSL